MHTLLNLRGNIPSFIEITEAKKHDVNVLDQMRWKPVPSTLWTGLIWILNDSTRCAEADNSLSGPSPTPN